MEQRIHTDFLVPEDSALGGAGAIFNVFGGSFYIYNRSGSGADADARAIRQDFAMIGQDIRDVASAAKAEEDKQLPLGL